MKIELHILQNFPPHCLNRDDTNSPKDCLFGGFRRARISSQCAKRAIRKYFAEEKLLPAEQVALRTKRVAEAVANRLVLKGRDRESALAVAQAGLTAMGLGLKEGRTEYLLFLAGEGVEDFANVCNELWDTLADPISSTDDSGKDDKKKSAKQKKRDAQEAFSREDRVRLSVLLDGVKAVDLALFGRMLADIPGQNVDGACQVAHALSTNEVQTEMDFYTAVDDLMPSEETGAGMMGVVEFNSACFYRYLVLDWAQFKKNLKEDQELARAGALAFLEAAVKAIPTGKQNSFAAQNLPFYVRVIVREDQPWNLANAFVKPIRPRQKKEEDLASLSIAALEGHFKEMSGMYGSQGVLVDQTARLGGGSVAELIKVVLNTLEV